MPNAIQEKLGSDAVNAEGVLAVQESMKMELNIRAPWDGTNIRSLCKEDNMVERHSHVITIEPLEHSVEVWPTRQTTQTTTRCTVSDFPEHVEFHEEGPREGFQIEKTMYPLEERAALVDALSETGLTQIQVASFVNPKVEIGRAHV